VTGAEYSLVREELPEGNFNVSRRTGRCYVGLSPGAMLENGRVTLVHWEVLFTEPPQDVVFRLDPAGLHSCKELPGCSEGEVPALYVGTMASTQHGLMFGAGYIPAYLNAKEEPDLTPVFAEKSWRQAGVMTSEGPKFE